ncbi:hypothetical protein ACWCXX_36260 [Streptomyces sp. NPDC001732]
MDTATAFGPGALLAGAILPDEGLVAMRRPDGPPSAALDAEHDGWVAPDIPVLVRGRGRARILPLAWSGDPLSEHRDPDASPERIAELSSRMQETCMYWAGPWRVLDLEAERSDSIGSYTAALRSAGATKVDCWTCSEDLGLALARTGDENAGAVSLALHVVPRSWVSEPPAWVSKRRAKDWRPVPGIDVRCSWADVIALHAE